MDFKIPIIIFGDFIKLLKLLISEMTFFLPPPPLVWTEYVLDIQEGGFHGILTPINVSEYLTIETFKKTHLYPFLVSVNCKPE